MAQTSQTKHLTSLDFDISKLKTQLAEIEKLVKSTTANIENATQKTDFGFGDTLKKDLSSVKSQISKMEKEVKDFRTTANKKIDFDVNISDAQSKIDKLEKQIKEMQQKAEVKVTATVDTKSATASAHAAVQHVSSTGGYLINQLKQQSLQYAQQAAKETLEVLRDVESASSEIGRVLELNIDQTTDLTFKMFDIAERYGRCIEDAQDITLKFAQAGYNPAESLKMTENALLAMNTAELDATDSTDSMIAILKQWGFSANDLITVIDKLNYTADNNAITTQDLVDALMKSSSMAKTANMSFDDTVGVLTAMKESSGAAGKEVGNAFKSILAYIQRAKSLTSFEKIGIKVFADEETGELLPMMDILQNMAAKWHDMSSEMQDTFVQAAEEAGLYSEELAIGMGLTDEYTDMINAQNDAIKANDEEARVQADKAAGVYRRNYYVALMENFSKALKVSNDLQYSVGHSAQENDRYMDTLDAKVKVLVSSLKELAYTAGDKGLMDVAKWAVDAATGLAKAAKTGEGLADILRTVVGLIMVFDANGLAEIGAGLTDTVKNIINLIRGIRSFNPASIIASIGLIILAIQGIKTAIDAAGLTIDGQKKRVENAFAAYADAQEQVATINSELSTTKDRIAELENKGALTFIEKSELDNLKEATAQLQIQADLAEKEEQRAAKKAAEESLKLFDKQYDASYFDPNNIQKQYNIRNEAYQDGGDVLEGEKYNIADLIAAYQFLVEKKQEALNAGDTQGSKIYQQELDDTEEKLWNNIDALQEFISNTEKLNMDDLSDDQRKQFTDNLELAQNGIREIYSLLDPEKWQGIQLDEILSDEAYNGLSGKLTALGKAGILNGDFIRQNFADFNSALEASGLTADEVAENFLALQDSTAGCEESISAMDDTIADLNLQIDAINAQDISPDAKSEKIEPLQQQIQAIQAAKDRLNGVTNIQIDTNAESVHNKMVEIQNFINWVNENDELPLTVKSQLTGDAQAQLDELQVVKQSLEGTTPVSVATTGTEEAKDNLNAVADAQKNIADKTQTTVLTDTSQVEQTLNNIKASAEKPIEIPVSIGRPSALTGEIPQTSETQTITITVDDSQAQEVLAAINAQLDGISEKAETVSGIQIGKLGAEATKLHLSDVLNALQKIEDFKFTDKSVKVSADATGFWNVVSSIAQAEMPVKTVRIQTKTDGQLASGTDNATRGNYLVGEKGREVVVTRDSWFVAEEPMIIPLNHGDMVFNNRDTEKILAGMGKRAIEGKAGKAYASGTENYAALMALLQKNIKDIGGSHGKDLNFNPNGYDLDLFLASINHDEAMGKFEDNELKHIKMLEYALNHLATDREDKWKLEEEIYKLRKSYMEEEQAIVDERIADFEHLNNMGVWTTDQQIGFYRELLNTASFTTDKQREYETKLYDLYVKQINEKIKLAEEEYNKRVEAINDAADKEIAALQKVKEERSRSNDEEDYYEQRKKLLEDLAYWEERTGRNAVEQQKDLKEQLAELDKDWARKQEDWKTEDQIQEIEDERDRQTAALEESWKAVQDKFTEENIDMLARAGVYSESLYQEYFNNFLSPFMDGMEDVGSALDKLAASTLPSGDVPGTAKPLNITQIQDGNGGGAGGSGSSNAGNISEGSVAKASSSAQIYAYKNGGGQSQYYANDPRYRVLKIDGDWVQVRHATLSNGVTGWFKKSDLTPYAMGTYNAIANRPILINENGLEALTTPDGTVTSLPSRGYGVIPSNITKNLTKIGKIDAGALDRTVRDSKTLKLIYEQNARQREDQLNRLVAGLNKAARIVENITHQYYNTVNRNENHSVVYQDNRTVNLNNKVSDKADAQFIINQARRQFEDAMVRAWHR